MFSPTVSSSSSMPLRFFSASSAQLLHVLTNSLKLLLDALKVLLGKLSPLNSPLELSLLDSQLPAQLVQLLLVVSSHLDGGPQVLVQLLNGDLVVQASVLHNLDGLHDIVSRLGGDGELGDGGTEGLGRLLVFLLHQHDPPGEGGHIALHLLELLLGLLQRLVGLVQLVVGLIETNLKLLDFLTVVTDVAVSLVGPSGGLPGVLLEAIDGGVEAVSLSLQGLHLLPDGVHGGGCSCWRRELSPEVGR